MKKVRFTLIVLSVLILLGTIGMTALLLFSNYRNVRLFRQAQSNFLKGDKNSLESAEAQLLQLIRNDADNEAAYIMLGKIAGQWKIYPEQIFYCYKAHRLNPLSAENKKSYIQSLLFAREFERLENFLVQESTLSDTEKELLFYASGRNGTLQKHKELLSLPRTKGIAKLAHLLFNTPGASPRQKLDILAKEFPNPAPFLKQELLAAQAELSLTADRVDDTGKFLRKAYELNEYAFAPALGRFYANYRTFKQALEVFEKYLEVYHDQSIALQTAEIYCLLKKADKIDGLRRKYQDDTGTGAMLCSYYFDALTALIKNDTARLKALVPALQNRINTPLAAFIFLYNAFQQNDLSAIQSCYAKMIEQPAFLDLHLRSDGLVLEVLKRAVAARTADSEQLYTLAERLYARRPDAFTAKFLLLAQRKKAGFSTSLLKSARKLFPKDRGLLKIAIEHALSQEPAAVPALIASYKKLFPKESADMLRYELVCAVRLKNFERASQLFMQNDSPQLRGEYWNFASSTNRKKDLEFLGKHPLYAPFCQALLLMASDKKAQGLDLLEKADAKGDLALLFFAARTLGENGRHKAALAQYAKFPPNSPYAIAVLLNSSELHAAEGALTKSLELAHNAYHKAPDLPAVQFCYADKLHKTNRAGLIPDIVKLTNSPFREKLIPLYIAGLEARLRTPLVQQDPEKCRDICRQILLLAPDNPTALETQKHLKERKK